MSDDDALAVWNRACGALMDPDIELREGDRALVAAIELNGVIENGGVATLDEAENVDQGVAGLRWFGLDAAADLVERLQHLLAGGLSLVELEQAELDGNDQYAQLDMSGALEERLARADRPA